MKVLLAIPHRYCCQKCFHHHLYRQHFSLMFQHFVLAFPGERMSESKTRQLVINKAFSDR